ncbi:hypothetical protein, partial [Hymenobacter antarcticus]|uniref:hypothetical protein n=1 Tax=Hymenobacter antarcticus TaxID=486270 RepID=UPI0031E9F60C
VLCWIRRRVAGVVRAHPCGNFPINSFGKQAVKVPHYPPGLYRYSVQKGEFEGIGGLENLTEILEYFLDTFLPFHLDAACTIEIGLPVVGYEGRLWLNVEGKMIYESLLEITAIEDCNYGATGSYLWSNDETLEALNRPGNIPLEVETAFDVGDQVEPTIFQADDNMLRTFLVAPAKK